MDNLRAIYYCSNPLIEEEEEKAPKESEKGSGAGGGEGGKGIVKGVMKWDFTAPDGAATALTCLKNTVVCIFIHSFTHLFINY